jgi:hypothetical protein
MVEGENDRLIERVVENQVVRDSSALIHRCMYEPMLGYARQKMNIVELFLV